MIKAIRKSFGCDKLNGYIIFLLGTHPIYDVRAPGNQFTRDAEYTNSRRDRTFLPIPLHLGNSWNLAAKIVDILHQSAPRSLKDVTGTHIDISIHERCVCEF